MLTPSVVSATKDKVEAFKLMAEITSKCHQQPMTGRKNAILMALEERAKEMGMASGKTASDGEPPLVMTKPLCRPDREALGSLSSNPANLKYRSAQRLLDDCDDDVDEIGVSLPDDYRPAEEDKGQENTCGVAEGEKTDKNTEPSSSETTGRGKTKSRAKKSKKAEGEDNRKEAGEDTKVATNGTKGGTLAVEEYEDHLRKVEEKLRESGKDLSKTDSGLNALLAEFRRNLLGSDPNLEYGRDSKDYAATKEDLTSVWIAGGQAAVDSSGSGSEGGGAELPGADMDLSDEDDGDEELDEEERQDKGVESTEGGVASSWYSISETAGGAGTSVGNGPKDEDEVQGMYVLCKIVCSVKFSTA